MSEITLLSAEQAKLLDDLLWRIPPAQLKAAGIEDIGVLCLALHAVHKYNSVCLPVSALREIAGEMRKQAELYRLNSNNVVATLCGNAFNEFADTIEKLLPAKE